MYPEKMRMCEIMASLVCDTSLLRSTDYRLKNKSFSTKVCDKCELGVLESVKHLVMQCPFYSNESSELFYAISRLDSETAKRVINEPQQYFMTLMGKQPEGASFEEMLDVWMLAGETISRLYKSAIYGR